MFYLSNDIEQITGVTAVLHHKDTQNTGRWNVLTTNNYFKSVIEAIRLHLSEWIKMYEDRAPTDNTLPPPNLAFKSSRQDDDSGNSFQTYLSVCSSIYCITDETYNAPPVSSFPPSQAWGNTTVPIFIEPTTTITSPLSNHSPDAYAALQQQNLQMQKELAALHSKVHQLSQERDNNLKQLSPPPVTYNPPLQDIVAAVVKALESRSGTYLTTSHDSSQSQERNTSEHKRKSMTSANTSLDSSLMDDYDA